jgi:YgiT-type zinc finger domain-containing protein
MVEIKICPSCGGNTIAKVRRTWTGEIGGRRYTIKNLTFHECSACGERVYDPEAMRAIEAASPAFAKAGAVSRTE